MPRHPERPLNPFFEEQMLRGGWPHIQAMADASGIVGSTLRTIAYGGHETARMATLIQVARAFGLPTWALIRGLDLSNSIQKAS